MILKYRAWDSWRKRMSVVDRIYIDTEGVRLYDDFGEYWRDFRDIKLMQSTGLTDKNGKEIFDGDIVRTTRFLGRADEIGGFYEYEKDYVGVVKVLEGSWVIDTGSVAGRLWS